MGVQRRESAMSEVFHSGHPRSQESVLRIDKVLRYKHPGPELRRRPCQCSRLPFLEMLCIVGQASRDNPIILLVHMGHRELEPREPHGKYAGTG